MIRRVEFTRLELGRWHQVASAMWRVRRASDQRSKFRTLADMKEKIGAPASRRETTTWETVEETANRLRISTRLLRELMKNGTVPFHRAGRRVVLDAVEVDEAIRRTMRKAA